MDNLFSCDLLKCDGSFKDREVEKQFILDEWETYKKRIRIILLLTGLAYLAGSHGDFLSFGTTNPFYILLAARFITFIISVISNIISYSKKYFLCIQKCIFIYFISITITESIELTLKPYLGQDTIPFLLFVVIGYFLFFNAGLKYLLIGEVLGTGIYFFTLIHTIHAPLNIVSPSLITFLFVIILSVFFTTYFNRTRRSEYYAMKELLETNKIMQNEIEKREEVEKKLLQLSITDELTQINNRRHFNELAEREIKRTQRTKQKLSLLFIDIDHFKNINDTYGHDIGDVFLKKLAESITQNIREIDIAGRYGGEEFAVLLPETETSVAEVIAERLRSKIADISIEVNEKFISITISIGISSLEDVENYELKDLITNADFALYRAKNNGRNQVSVWEK